MNLLLKISFTACLLLAIIQICYGHHISSRIAHGHDANPHSAPYIISLQVTSKGEHVHSCGGTILNENWILTAAHCFNGMKVSEMLIQAGRHNIKMKSEPTEQRRKIHWYKKHEEYGGNIGPNDLALIYVEEPFIWNESVQPVKLPKTDIIPSGMATLFGWGLLQTVNPIFPAILQTVDIPILPMKDCMNFPGFSEYLSLTNVCTFDSLGSSSCSSDSGGPLVQVSTENEIEIIGVVSWGPAVCGIPNKSASVYVRVSSFINWINKVQKEFVIQ